ncbi:MAG TPA: PhzF family phenazine biosynthesis protein [Nitrolancea sp.]|nr:PhzF family phenazine biosynthesis protein [Nitrolancea sp.]
MGQRVVQVDAFTSEAFRGNPAAVCVLEQPAEAEWMQLVAREMNLSETAFLVPNDAGYQLRWFTPAIEVDLCGHATLASAHVLWEDGHLAPDRVARFETLSGTLTAERDGDWIELDFPAEPEHEVPAPAALAEAFGATPRYVGRNRMDYLVEFEDEATVGALTPDMRLLKSIEARGFIATSRSSSPEFDFVSRFFGPAAGIDEDPVTGSSHCCLGPFWAARLGKDELLGHQISARGGVVRVRLAGDRIRLGGQAVTVMRGELI